MSFAEGSLGGVVGGDVLGEGAGVVGGTSDTGADGMDTDAAQGAGVVNDASDTGVGVVDGVSDTGAGGMDTGGGAAQGAGVVDDVLGSGAGEIDTGDGAAPKPTPLSGELAREPDGEEKRAGYS